MTCILHEDLRSFMISRFILHIMRNIADELCRQNQNTHLVFKIYFFFETHAVFEIMLGKMVERDGPQMTIY